MRISVRKRKAKNTGGADERDGDDSIAVCYQQTLEDVVTGQVDSRAELWLLHP